MKFTLTQKFLPILSVVLIITSLSSCNDDEENNSTPIVKLEASVTEANESQGEIVYLITLSNESSEPVKVEFTISGSALLDGDFSVETPSPITIPAGETSAELILNVIDESIIEPKPDEIIIELTGIDQNASLPTSSEEKKVTLEIEDNDRVPDNALQFDLVWQVNEDESINQANLDLYLANNAEFDEDGNIIDLDPVYWSANEKGFETVWLSEEDDDDEYYLVVQYTEGTEPADYILYLNGLGFENESAEGSFSATDAGRAYVYGPFNKSGSAVEIGGRMSWKKKYKFF